MHMGRIRNAGEPEIHPNIVRAWMANGIILILPTLNYKQGLPTLKSASLAMGKATTAPTSHSSPLE
jgi:hypothetical protein